MTEIVLLGLSLIRTDGGTQSRADLNQAVVRNYTDDMLNDVEFPALTVYYDGESYWLADGFHRLAAAQEAGFKEFECDVHQGTCRDAVLHSVGANNKHGLQRTNADKRRATTLLLEDEEWGKWSDHEIARRCGVSQPFVGNIRKELSDNGYQMGRKVERGGTTYTMQTGNIGRSAQSTPGGEVLTDGEQPANSQQAPAFLTTEDGEILTYQPGDRATCGHCGESHGFWIGPLPGYLWRCGRCSRDTVDDAMDVWEPPNGEAGREQQRVKQRAAYAHGVAVEKAAQALTDQADEDEPATGAESAGKHKPKTNRTADESVPQGFDACQTPPYALDPLLPYLDNRWTVWEPANGQNLLVEALYDSGFKSVIASDVLTGQNFFEYRPDKPWDCIVTNPPYSLKFRWLERCYQLGKPFALLVPVETIGAKSAQVLLKECGFEMMLLDQRVDFKMTNAEWSGSGAQFPVMWLTWHILPRQVMFGSIEEEKRKFREGLRVAVPE